MSDICSDILKEIDLNGFSVKDIAIGDYHSLEFMSRSKLMQFDQDQYLYYKKHIDKRLDCTDKESSAMRFGSAIHCYILENHLYEDSFYVKKRGEKEQENKTKLTESENKLLESLVKEYESFDQAKQLIDLSVKERSIFWKSGDLVLQSRPDAIFMKKGGPNMIIDVKTTSMFTEGLYRKSIYNFYYDLQAAMFKVACDMAFGEDFSVWHLVFDKKNLTSRLIKLGESVIQNGNDRLYKILDDISSSDNESMRNNIITIE